jgi:type VI secretion system protein ImpA
MIDLETLLREVDPVQPSGPNLEYDRSFIELERSAQGKPEQQIGATIVPAQEPDWRVVEDQATKLLTRTKDLRVALHLLKARLHNDGFVGFADGLGLLRALVERYWETLHPELDPEDHNDPTMRINILMGICDPLSMLAAVRTVPLVTSRSIGRFTLRDLAIVAGELAPSGGGEPPTAATLEAAFADSELAALETTATAVRVATEEISALETFVTDKVGTAHAPSFAKLATLLASAAKPLNQQLLRRGVRTEGVAATPGSGVESSHDGATEASLMGAIGSRDDVIRILDHICDYYSRVEPSSPVPLLLRRSKRLVKMSFWEIVSDLAPDGLSQLQKVAGVDGEGRS